MQNNEINLDSFYEDVRDYLKEFQEIINNDVSIEDLTEMVNYDFKMYKRKKYSERELNIPVDEMLHKAKIGLKIAHELKESKRKNLKISFVPYESVQFEHTRDSFYRELERNTQYNIRREKALKDYVEDTFNPTDEEIYEYAMGMYRSLYNDTLIETETTSNNIAQKKMALVLLKKGISVSEYEEEFK